jgi:BirA family biotin operon repressor/biotin-[acetyl-CoA-carboxylase] ligase
VSNPPPLSLAESALIDVVRLAGCLGEVACRLNVEALAECESTNAVLLSRGDSLRSPHRGSFQSQKKPANAALAASGSVLVADRQTAGRGRRGRRWWSAQVAPADSLTFSLLWRFPRGAALSGLSLAVGVALAEALAELGATGIKLKWPNDLLAETAEGFAKLGGILIELTSGASGTSAVIGIGLNLQPPREVPPDQLAAGIATTMRDGLPERHVLFAAVLRHLVSTLDLFAAQGFAPLRSAWEQSNAYADRVVRLIDESGPDLVGRCLGVDDDGALRVDTADGVRRWLAGDVSLRPLAAGAGDE